MAKAMVKCLFCGKQFDRLSEPCVKVGEKRYAHKKCYDEQPEDIKHSQEEKDAFFQYIKKLYGPDYNFIAISRLAENYINQYNFSYSGMLKSLKWYYEVEHGSTENSNESIGIIPYIYEKAKKYYYNIYLAQQRNKDVNNYTLEVKEVVIARPRVLSTAPKLFDLGDED